MFGYVCCPECEKDVPESPDCVLEIENQEVLSLEEYQCPYCGEIWKVRTIYHVEEDYSYIVRRDDNDD